MNTLIVTGGNINKTFLQNNINNNKYNNIIAVDKGLEVLQKISVLPTHIIGDFDSVNKQTLDKYKKTNIEILTLNLEKDFTDTHMAVKLAIKLQSTDITIIGAIGTRIDHTMANIHILKEPLDNNIKCRVINENNEIYLINKKAILTKNNNFKYISLLPLTTTVKGLTIKGMKYNLEKVTLKIGESLGISNEQIKEEATIEIEEGILILIYSKD